jgi:RHS repeat-associated protein
MSLNDWGDPVTIDDGPRSFRLSYSREAELTELVMPNGMRQRFRFDACSRLSHREVIATDGRVLAFRSFSYDQADQLVATDDWRRGRREFSYDLAGRLRSVRNGNREIVERYEFDSEGNLLSSPDFETARITAGNRMINAGDREYEYDAAGFLVRVRSQADEMTFTYDAWNQLIGVSKNGALISEYQYDLTGRRILKRVDDDEQRFYYHVNTPSTLISSKYGRWDFLFLPFSFIPLAQTGPAGTFSYSWDQAGVPTEVWDEEGELVAVLDGQAFGSGRQVIQTKAGAVLLPFHFMGQWVDHETGLHYNRFRYYDPRCARFTSQDPFGLAGGLNLYTYPLNPLNRVDPMGLRGLVLQIKCVPSEPPPFTPCEQRALQRKAELMNEDLQDQGRKARCTKCRDNEQKDYFIEKCGGTVPKGWQVDHIQELQVGGADKCCKNLMAIPQRPNGSCGSQIYHQLKDYGGVVVGCEIAKPGCKSADQCKSDGTKRGTDTKSCEEPNPVC